MRIFDRVKETSTTTGAGDITLAGAVTQFITFASVYATGERVPYAIVGQSGAEWEVGLGTLTGATTLARTEVYRSSNAGASVNFSAGTKDVFVTFLADWAERLTSIGRVVASNQGVFLP